MHASAMNLSFSHWALHHFASSWRFSAVSCRRHAGRAAAQERIEHRIADETEHANQAFGKIERHTREARLATVGSGLQARLAVPRALVHGGAGAIVRGFGRAIHGTPYLNILASNAKTGLQVNSGTYIVKTQKRLFQQST